MIKPSNLISSAVNKLVRKVAIILYRVKRLVFKKESYLPSAVIKVFIT